MSNTIVKERYFFSLHEYEEEEKLLREKSKAGLKLVGIKCGINYSFEKSTPEDVVYRLDFKQLKKSEMEEYIQMYSDFGWEYVLSFNDYHYFRKAAEFQTEADLEIFSDNESRAGMAIEILKKKLIPFIITAICSTLVLALDYQNILSTRHILAYALIFIWGIILIVDFIQIYRCGKGLRILKNKYAPEE